MVAESWTDGALRVAVRRLLEKHWDVALDDARAVRELAAVLDGQLPGGMVPHMRYGAVPPDTWLGPLPLTSSLTQPPMFGHAIKVVVERGFDVPAGTLDRAVRGLDWLWTHRRTDRDLMYVVHPWEAGNDHSPRWDAWGAPGTTPADWDRPARTAWNKARMGDVTFHADGAAAWSSTFVAAPAGFNAYVAFNLAELAAALDDRNLADRAARIAAAMDEHLWDENEALWCDLAIVGGHRQRVCTPISDGVMGALVTPEATRADAALAQLDLPDRFGAPFGPTNVARSHSAYDPGMYWRGVAWPHLNYLLWLALRRQHRLDEASALARRTLETAMHSGFAEYWHPETGAGLGAIPQSWTALALAMSPDTAGRELTP